MYAKHAEKIDVYALNPSDAAYAQMIPAAVSYPPYATSAAARIAYAETEEQGIQPAQRR